nr:hypothetical protein Itr_chr07CG07570 [Ipomoea trifida]
MYLDEQTGGEDGEEQRRGYRWRGRAAASGDGKLDLFAAGGEDDEEQRQGYRWRGRAAASGDGKLDLFAAGGERRWLWLEFGGKETRPARRSVRRRGDMWCGVVWCEKDGRS